MIQLLKWTTRITILQKDQTKYKKADANNFFHGVNANFTSIKCIVKDSKI